MVHNDELNDNLASSMIVKDSEPSLLSIDCETAYSIESFITTSFQSFTLSEVVWTRIILTTVIADFNYLRYYVLQMNYPVVYSSIPYIIYSFDECSLATDDLSRRGMKYYQ